MKKETIMIENPFEFGRAVEDEYFTDRIDDAKRLEANLTHGINTILISPRRWGKTSLVKKVISQSKRKDVKFIFVDIFSCKSDYEFCRCWQPKPFAKRLPNGTSGFRWERPFFPTSPRSSPSVLIP